MRNRKLFRIIAFPSPPGMGMSTTLIIPLQVPYTYHRALSHCLVFVKDLFAFIEGALAKGECVMVHCLAGAHRAGTTGVSCLIHFTGNSVPHGNGFDYGIM